MSGHVNARWEALILAQITAGPLTARELAARLPISLDHLYLATSGMRRDGTLIITDRRLVRDARLPRPVTVMVFGLPGRDPVHAYRRAAPGAGVVPGRPRKARNNSGSGQIAGSAYHRGLANW